MKCKTECECTLIHFLLMFGKFVCYIFFVHSHLTQTTTWQDPRKAKSQSNSSLTSNPAASPQDQHVSLSISIIPCVNNLSFPEDSLMESEYIRREKQRRNRERGTTVEIEGCAHVWWFVCKSVMITCSSLEKLNDRNMETSYTLWIRRLLS